MFVISKVWLMKLQHYRSPPLHDVGGRNCVWFREHLTFQEICMGDFRQFHPKISTYPHVISNIKVISVILHSTGKFWVFSYFLLFPIPPHFQQSSTSWPFTSLYYFPPHPSHIPSPLSLSLSLCNGWRRVGLWRTNMLIKKACFTVKCQLPLFSLLLLSLSLLVSYSGKLWNPCSTSTTAYVWK